MKEFINIASEVTLLKLKTVDQIVLRRFQTTFRPGKFRELLIENVTSLLLNVDAKFIDLI